MAGKTTAESIRSLEIELATLRTHLDEFRSAIDRAGPFDLRERFVLLEHRVAELDVHFISPWAAFPVPS